MTRRRPSTAFWTTNDWSVPPAPCPRRLRDSEMRPLIQEIATAHTPESLVEQLYGEAGIVLLRTSSFDSPSARYSFITANPFLTFRSFGSRCEISRPQTPDAGPNSGTRGICLTV